MDSNRKEVLRAFEENKSYIKAKSDEGIKQNRIGKCKIRVEDANGVPMKNVLLHIKQKNHEFKYVQIYSCLMCLKMMRKI